MLRALALFFAATIAVATPTALRRDGVTTLSNDHVDPWRVTAQYAA